MKLLSSRGELKKLTKLSYKTITLRLKVGTEEQWREVDPSLDTLPVYLLSELFFFIEFYIFNEVDVSCTFSQMYVHCSTVPFHTGAKVWAFHPKVHFCDNGSIRCPNWRPY